jgi:hypothetical protein
MKMSIKIFGVFILSVFFNYSYGQEGNYKFENYGNEPALLTGNVTASISDLALTYYNPARLVFVDTTKFLISIKAYQFDKFTYENKLGEGKNISDSEFNGIPSMIAGEFNVKFLPNHKFAYSLISRYRTERGIAYESGILDNSTVVGIEDSSGSLINIDFQTKLKDEWFGLTWAHKINDNFSIGASTFFSVYQFREKGELLISEQGVDGGVSLLSDKLDYEQSAYGLFLKLGMAYRIADIEIGANISLPYIGISNDASLLIQDFSSGVRFEDKFLFYNGKGLKNKRKTALEMALGMGVPIGKDKRSKIRLNVEWHSKINEYEKITLPASVLNDNTEQSKFNEEFKTVINFGAGMNLFLTSNATLFLSVSSDFNAFISSVSILDELFNSEKNVNVFNDFWHFGLGTDLKTRWGDLYTGFIYSYTSTNVKEPPPVISQNIYQFAEGALGGVKYQRLRVVIGFEIPIFIKLNKLKNKLK